MTNSKFKLGRLVSTIGVHTKMEEDPRFAIFVRASLYKYINSDWGDTCAEDAQKNDYAAEHDERILAVYENKKADYKIWIITEWDRSTTTILFPDEY